MEQESALIDAAARADLGRVIDLLARGADPNAADAEGWTPLLRGVLVGSSEIVTLLLDAGADVNVRALDGSTPLLKATLWRHVEIARLLLDRGANTHAIDDRGWTALGVALLIEHDELAEMLRRASVSPRLTTNSATNGRDPIRDGT